MTKTTLKFLVALLIVAMPVASFVFESQIQHTLPGFRAAVVLSGVILIAGGTLSIIIRHLGIFLASLAMAIALPFLIDWMVYYWPYVAGHYFG